MAADWNFAKCAGCVHDGSTTGGCPFRNNFIYDDKGNLVSFSCYGEHNSSWQKNQSTGWEYEDG